MKALWVGGQTLKGADVYKMTVYTAEGKMFRVERAKNLAYFDRYKGKRNYRIVITEGKKLIYSER